MKTSVRRFASGGMRRVLSYILIRKPEGMIRRSGALSSKAELAIFFSRIHRLPHSELTVTWSVTSPHIQLSHAVHQG